MYVTGYFGFDIKLSYSLSDTEQYIYCGNKVAEVNFDLAVCDCLWVVKT